MQFKNHKQYRYQEYDYSQDGMYFITICTNNKEIFFGNIVGKYFNGYIDGAIVQISEIGQIVNKYWLEIPKHFPNVILDEYMIMPNHVHGIIQIKNNNVGTGQCPVPVRGNATQTAQYAITNVSPSDRTGQCPVPTRIMRISKFGSVTSNSISTIVGSFKSIVTKIVNKQFPESGFVWQARFYDRIIRNEEELYGIRQYIINNPFKWLVDRDNPKLSK
ncbi:MAG: transposase [Patescibacteria group bacterium]|nr:transposase [Patescibacteria group bacterium]MDD4610428.1 transposase [Patescibacteria group bacterium]